MQAYIAPEVRIISLSLANVVLTSVAAEPSVQPGASKPIELPDVPF